MGQIRFMMCNTVVVSSCMCSLSNLTFRDTFQHCSNVSEWCKLIGAKGFDNSMLCSVIKCAWMARVRECMSSMMLEFPLNGLSGCRRCTITDLSCYVLVAVFLISEG